MARQAFRRGFSLIELIVVMAVIALLMALLMPQVGKARNRATAVVCGTNMRDLGLALKVYLSSWSDVMPVNGVIMPKSGMPKMYVGNALFQGAEARYNDQWRLEFGALWSYRGGGPLPPGTTIQSVAANISPNALPVPQGDILKGYKSYICPGDVPYLTRTYTGTGADATTPLYMEMSNPPHVKQGVGSPGFYSYSVNSVMNSLGRFRDRFSLTPGDTGNLPWTDPLKVLSIKTDSQFITFIEEDNNSLFNDEVVDAPAYSEGDMLTGRHNNRGNVAFADQHVEAYSQVVFNQVVSGIKNPDGTDKTYVDHTDAMQSEITRMFFPDRGAFANP